MMFAQQLADQLPRAPQVLNDLEMVALPLESIARRSTIASGRALDAIVVMDRLNVFRVELTSPVVHDRGDRRTLETAITLVFAQPVAIGARAIMGETRLVVSGVEMQRRALQTTISTVDATLTRGVPNDRTNDTAFADGVRRVTFENPNRNAVCYVLLYIFYTEDSPRMSSWTTSRMYTGERWEEVWVEGEERVVARDPRVIDQPTPRPNERQRLRIDQPRSWQNEFWQ